MTVAVTAAPPGVVPLVHVNIIAAQVNTVDPQFAKQEAALIGSLTAVALGKLGVPASFAAVLGSQVTVGLLSPSGQAALQSFNNTAIDGMVAGAEAPYGLAVATSPYGFPTDFGNDHSGNGPNYSLS